ncbi:MAG: PD-(D/E)XK nuclease-like domain-containing protein [Muribaculaceae bacterium]|nr:PD-(D/E)XK nuclease-like domain-containing protein [Muribaculaceae bacterium]
MLRKQGGTACIRRWGVNGRIIPGLPNEDYHSSKPWSDYLSSSQLKLYLKSPKAARWAIDNPQPQTDAMRFGSLFHDLMASMASHWDNGTEAIGKWIDGIAVFEPPVNPKTGQPYGAATKAYAEAYQQFLADSKGKTVASQAELSLVSDMAKSLIVGCGSTSEQVRNLLKWGKPEVSHFVEYEGLKFKFRPDLETRRKIIDHKTVATDDLSERSINNIIARYGYDISAAYYLFMEHEQSGTWKTFYWLFVSKVPPFDAVLVDASEWTYKHDPDTGIVMPQVGAIKMKRLLDLHIRCERNGVWPGAEIYIPDDGFGRRIMTPTPPPWEVSNASSILEQSFEE